MVAHYGSYNFVPKKTRGTVSIVPAYRNKWPRWRNYWFYHRVCSNEEVVEALAHDVPKAHILLSQMTPMEGFCLAEFRMEGEGNVAAADGFALTSRWQISLDLVKEWIACDSPPLSSETWFFEFERRGRYIYPNLGVAVPDAFSTDFDFVNYVEHKTKQIIGLYGDKEHKARCQCLGGKRRLNRVFDDMGLCYADRDGPSTSLPIEEDAPRGRGSRGRRGR